MQKHETPDSIRFGISLIKEQTTITRNKIQKVGNNMEKTTLYCTYSKFGKDTIMFINRKTLDNGTEFYSSDSTIVTAIIKKVNNAYVVNAYRNKDEYDFFGKQSKVFKTLSDARKGVENGFKKWDNYYGELNI